MKNSIRIRLLALTLYLLFPQLLANEMPPFDYSKTWRIIYFQDNTQFVNQRPMDYNPTQGFIVIFELLNKYVANLQPFEPEATDEKIQSLGIWAQLYLINDVTYQELLLGNHILSDGKGWVVMKDEDYEKLSQLLIERKSKTGDPFDGDKEQALKKLFWKDNGQGPIESFDTQFRSASQPATQDSPGSSKRPVNIPPEPESHSQPSVSIEASKPPSETLVNKITTRPEDRTGASTPKNNNAELSSAKNSHSHIQDSSNSSKFIYAGVIVMVLGFLTLFHRRKKNR